MSFDKSKGECFCERCGHFWKTKPFDNHFIEPRSCGKCKSKVWNQPRTYGGKYLAGNAPMAIRFKPTGRAAANLKPEKIIKEKLHEAKVRLRLAQQERDKLNDILSDPMNFLGTRSLYDRNQISYYVNEYRILVEKEKFEIQQLQAEADTIRQTV